MKKFLVIWLDGSEEMYYADRTWTSEGAVHLLVEKKKGDGYDTLAILNINSFKKIEDKSL